jgi:hypothetical protein
MSDDYDPAADGFKSYYAALEAKRLRGDIHDWTNRKPNQENEMNFAQELRELITAALEAGVSRDTIISELEDAAAYLTEEEQNGAADVD